MGQAEDLDALRAGEERARRRWMATPIGPEHYKAGREWAQARHRVRLIEMEPRPRRLRRTLPDPEG